MKSNNLKPASKDVPLVKLTRAQCKTINRMAHQRAIYLFPAYEYKVGFKASQERYRVLYKNLMAVGNPFEEIAALIQEPRLEAATSRLNRLQEMKSKLLSIPVSHPFASRSK